MEENHNKMYLAIIYISDEDFDDIDYEFSCTGEALPDFICRVIKSYQCDNVDIYRSSDLYKICEI